MNYSEAIQFLYGLQMFGANFGLENTRKLAALAGNPQEKLRFIHVAGTNGKGSTCAMLESIYRTAGLRVGLFTSPHLVSFRERIQVNRQLIPENELIRLVEEIQPLLKQFPADNHLTLFEVVTVMALKFFAEQKCDLVIWETGLGGRLDATNIVTPLASVITNIAFDHQQWLGDTLEKIAAEKAGIIKPGIPVVTATDEPSALAVIKKIAREKKAHLKIVNRLAGTLAPPLLGEHQKTNAALAMAAVEFLQKQIPVPEEKIREGLQNVNWPGRLQLVKRSNGQKILLDGAHNVASAKVLRQALEKIFPTKVRTLILGILQDKDWRKICEMLAPLAAKIFLVPVASERSANPKELAEICRTANPAAEIFICSSLKEALAKSGSRGRSPHQAENFIVVTGSLYLVGEALELLGLSPAAQNERALNEWTSKRATK
ncbi:MAG TPA: folylpolyglutamate synthase/dihydrofolate synthase family protein [Verrucomicrobiae bacterium]